MGDNIMSFETNKLEAQFATASNNDKAEPTAEEILLRASRRIDLHEEMARNMRARGVLPERLMRAPAALDYLTGYDMVTAITQNTINSQLRKLWAEDVIRQHLDLVLDEDEGVNLSADIAAPTVSLDVAGSQHRVIFNLPLVSGSFTRWKIVKGRPVLESLPIENWVLAFEVNMGIAQIERSYLDAGKDKGTIPKEVIKSLENFTDDHFNISHLFLDFQNADLSNLDQARTVMPNLKPTESQQLTELLNAYIRNLKGTDNPYILGYSVATKDPSKTANIMPIFRPTYCTYSTHKYQAAQPNPGIDTLNYLLMTDKHSAPTNPQAGIFNINWVESEDVYGSMAVSRALFERNYVEALVLQNIKQSLGVPSNFSRSGDVWALKYEDVHKETYPKADSGIKDIYGEYTNKVEFNASVMRGTSPSITVNGRFFRRSYVYEDWGFLGRTEAWANITLDWRVIIRFSAGSDGRINTSIEVTKISGPTIDKHVDALFVMSDWFGGNIGPITDRVAQAYADLQNLGVSQLGSACGNAFNRLQQLTVLPAGEVFFYKDLQINDEGDLLLHITYKD